METRFKPGVEYACGPTCGIGCTKASFDRATREGNELATRMGPGWVARVWENLGWHYSVKKGVAEIYPKMAPGGGYITGDWEVQGYSCNLDTTPQVIAWASTPEDALGFAVQDARGVIQRIAGALAEVQS